MKLQNGIPAFLRDRYWEQFETLLKKDLHWKIFELAKSMKLQFFFSFSLFLYIKWSWDKTLHGTSRKKIKIEIFNWMFIYLVYAAQQEWILLKSKLLCNEMKIIRKNMQPSKGWINLHFYFYFPLWNWNFPLNFYSEWPEGDDLERLHTMRWKIKAKFFSRERKGKKTREFIL